MIKCLSVTCSILHITLSEKTFSSTEGALSGFYPLGFSRKELCQHNSHKFISLNLLACKNQYADSAWLV